MLKILIIFEILFQQTINAQVARTQQRKSLSALHREKQKENSQNSQEPSEENSEDFPKDFPKDKPKDLQKDPQKDLPKDKPKDKPKDFPTLIADPDPENFGPKSSESNDHRPRELIKIKSDRPPPPPKKAKDPSALQNSQQKILESIKRARSKDIKDIKDPENPKDPKDPENPENPKNSGFLAAKENFAENLIENPTKENSNFLNFLNGSFKNRNRLKIFTKFNPFWNFKST